MFKKLICFMTCVIISTSGLGKSLKGVEFPETKTVNEMSLVLNGLGLRLATIFGVKVYVGALYLDKKETDTNKILANTNPKQVVMHFLRDVEKEDLIKGFKEGFENNGINYKENQDKWDVLFNTLPNVKEGEKITITLEKDGITVATKNNTEVLKGFPPANKFVALWIQEAPNDELKEGMLGL